MAEESNKRVNAPKESVDGMAESVTEIEDGQEVVGEKGNGTEEND
ncbi:hypothetical protein GCM10010329_17560 [Streptomyces spiroverticillatus]|uniref:Uncharacterized protein n=1 Tax=Streptomyces finlayi TaxID=67296 RepID=A0A918WTR4_9ACTN|nr:hypothetical protein [Streptomyces finlayi]GGZ96810.1 hypothetical protein GCM10010329_17560 [Streptomyces spiroverticillatus]GHC82092.1 hypothetical protein GCM10010334_10040 [Streptomyces finlayi]